MKRILTVIAVAAVVLVAASIIYFTMTRPAPGWVDAPKVLAAAQAYAHDLQPHGLVVPATVALQDLIAKRLLSPADVSGFAGMEVTVSLTASDSFPQDILMRVRMQDGSQIVSEGWERSTSVTLMLSDKLKCVGEVRRRNGEIISRRPARPARRTR